MGETRLYLIRHGQSEHNASGRLAGAIDSPLTALGRRQAAALAPQLSSWNATRIVASDLARAHDTALLAANDGMPVTRTAHLRERPLGCLENAMRTDVQDSEAFAKLLGWADAPRGAESQRSVAIRVLTWLAENVSDAPGERIVIVSHGGVIRCLLGLIDDMAWRDIGRISVANTSPTERRLPVGGWDALLAKAVGSPSG